MHVQLADTDTLVAPSPLETQALTKQSLSEQPRIDPTARVRKSTPRSLDVGRRAHVDERDALRRLLVRRQLQQHHVHDDRKVLLHRRPDAGSIRGNHPMERPALHHFTYRSESYQLGPSDDAEFFEWRRSHKVTLGHDVWIGRTRGSPAGRHDRHGRGRGRRGGGQQGRAAVCDRCRRAGEDPPLPFRREDAWEALLKLAWWDWSR